MFAVFDTRVLFQITDIRNVKKYRTSRFLVTNDLLKPNEYFKRTMSKLFLKMSKIFTYTFRFCDFSDRKIMFEQELLKYSIDLEPSKNDLTFVEYFTNLGPNFYYNTEAIDYFIGNNILLSEAKEVNVLWSLDSCKHFLYTNFSEFLTVNMNE